jgi:hypothetical protein
VGLISVGVLTNSREGSYRSGVQTRPETSSGEIMAMAIAIAAPVAVGLTGILALVARAAAVRRAHVGRRRSLAALKAEFPAEVEAWGGPDRLDSPAVVRAILDQVARPDFRVSPAAAVPPAPAVSADPMRVTVLRNRLLDFLNARTIALATNVALGALTIAVALPFACVMGVVSAEELGRQMAKPAAAIVGVLIWLGICGPPALTWWLVSRALRARLRRRADDLTRTYGPVFEQWVGPGFLDDRQALKGVISELDRPQAASQLPSSVRVE